MNLHERRFSPNFYLQIYVKNYEPCQQRRRVKHVAIYWQRSRLRPQSCVLSFLYMHFVHVRRKTKKLTDLQETCPHEKKLCMNKFPQLLATTSCAKQDSRSWHKNQNIFLVWQIQTHIKRLIFFFPVVSWEQNAELSDREITWWHTRQTICKPFKRSFSLRQTLKIVVASWPIQKSKQRPEPKGHYHLQCVILLAGRTFPNLWTEKHL